MSNDIDEGALSKLIANSKYPDLLKELAAISRHHFGWFTKQGSRATEYPWMAAQIGDPASLKIVDVGAGCSPLPIWLAQNGASVITLDYSIEITLKEVQSKHEWGFLNYAVIDPNIQSINADASTVSLSDIDVVYSVSVIEHMPAVVRRAVVRQAARWLKPGGRAFLTIDTVAGSQRLWNYNLGKEVESQAVHGTIEDMLAELNAAGLRVDSFDRPGIAMICCTKLS